MGRQDTTLIPPGGRNERMLSGPSGWLVQVPGSMFHATTVLCHDGMTRTAKFGLALLLLLVVPVARTTERMDLCPSPPPVVQIAHSADTR